MLPLHTTLLNHEELATACLRLSAIYNPLLATEPLLTKISAAAESRRDAIIQAIARKSTSDFTDPLKQKDLLRDAAFTALRDFIGSWTKSPLATAGQQSAAVRLQEIFDRHGNTIHRLGYNRQSGQMDSLIKDLQTAAATADIAALSLTPLFEQMVQAQSDFEALMADKAAAESGASVPTISENRPALEHHLNLILASLNTWLELDPNPELTEAAGRLDEVIVQIMTPALARRTKSTPAAPADPVPQP
jgi:hypothetical protein